MSSIVTRQKGKVIAEETGSKFDVTNSSIAFSPRRRRKKREKGDNSFLAPMSVFHIVKVK
jgi:hypothetical protein